MWVSLIHSRNNGAQLLDPGKFGFKMNLVADFEAKWFQIAVCFSHKSDSANIEIRSPLTLLLLFARWFW